jgi:hypothetical protein
MMTAACHSEETAMINMLKNWIRAVVREDAPGVTYPRQTLGHLKPGQTLTVTNRDGSQDKVTVKAAKIAEAKHTTTKTRSHFRKNGPSAHEVLESMLASDAQFRERYERALSVGISTGEVMIYEATGGYKKHARYLSVIVEERNKDGYRNDVKYSIRMIDHTRRVKSGGKGARTLNFPSAEQAKLSADYRIPLYHEICAEQARKTSKRGWQP